jgi:hypothetical protein
MAFLFSNPVKKHLAKMILIKQCRVKKKSFEFEAYSICSKRDVSGLPT